MCAGAVCGCWHLRAFSRGTALVGMRGLDLCVRARAPWHTQFELLGFRVDRIYAERTRLTLPVRLQTFAISVAIVAEQIG